MTDRELMQQALEALQAYGAHTPNCDHLMLLLSLPPQRKPCSCGLVAAITALRERLAQPEQKQDSTCNKTLRAEGKGYPRTCRKCGKGPCIADRVQPEQEPVAWMWKDGTITSDPDRADGTWTPLYTAPPQRKPLTDEEIEACRQQGYAHNGLSASFDFVKAARAIEAKLREKNNG